MVQLLLLDCLTLEDEGAKFLETLEATCQMTQRHLPEDLNSPEHNCKDLRFHITDSCFQNKQIKGQRQI
jgi:hypothetical protein